MKRGIVIGMVTLGAFTVSGIVTAQKHHRPAGPDAFLNYQVDSTSELVAALTSNPALRRRYARHFGVSEDRVIEFVKNALVPYNLPRARTFTTYGVTKSGKIYAVSARLPRGTKVWATRSGEPVLKWLCANPLTKTLPGTKLADAPRGSVPVTGDPQVATVRSLAPTEDAVDATFDPSMSPPEPAEPGVPPVPVAAIVPSDTPGVTVFTGPLAAPPTGINGRPGASLWFPVGLAVALALPHGGSPGSIGSEFGPGLSPPNPGGTTDIPDLSGPPGTPGTPGLPLTPGTPGVPGIPPIVPGVTPEPVPEPSTMVTMAALVFVSGVGILRNRRRRREGDTGRSVE